MSRRRCPVCHRTVLPTARNSILGHTDNAENVCGGGGLPFDAAERARSASTGPRRRVVTAQSIKNCTTANRRRAEAATRRRVTQAHKAIRTLETAPAPMKRHRMHLVSLRALLDRIRYPESSLQQIADAIGVTKDTYSARLRRAFEYAARLEGA